MASIAGNCSRCGIFRRWLHRDHVVPKYAGGLDESFNIQLLCANCHEDKTQEDRVRYGVMKSMLGKKHSPETIAKMSAAQKEAWRVKRLPVLGRRKAVLQQIRLHVAQSQRRSS